MNRTFLLQMLPQNSVGAEVGIWKGDFSQQVCNVVKPAKFYLIDPWLYIPQYNSSFYGNNKMSQAKMNQIHLGVVNRFKNNASVVVVRDKSVDAAGTIANDSLDWIYIDGDHTYEGVKADLAAYHPKIKVGGFLCGDDYTTGGWWAGGVKKAVDEFLTEHKSEYKLILIKDQQYILKRLI